MKKQNSPFDGIRIGWLELGPACGSEICSDGKKLALNWTKTADNRFSAELDFGVLNLEIIQLADGIRICSSLNLTGTLPESVIFTPLLIGECEPGHVFFCGEKMGRCQTAEFPEDARRNRIKIVCSTF